MSRYSENPETPGLKQQTVTAGLWANKTTMLMSVNKGI